MGRAINVNVTNPEITNCTIDGVRFQNIAYSSVLRGKLDAANAWNSVSVIFGAVTVDRVAIKAPNAEACFEKDDYSSWAFA
jgi:hypothetical protein